MPGISLGFGDRDYGYGTRNGIFDIISALTSEQRQPGFHGVAEAIGSPTAVMNREAGMRAQAEWQALWQRNAENQNIIGAGLSAGTPEGMNAADTAHEAMVTDFYRSGFDPSGLMQAYAVQSQRALQRGTQRTPLDAPDALPQLGRFSSGPAESAGLIESGVRNRGREAERLHTEQTTRQEGELFPLQREDLGAQTALRRAQTATEGVQGGLTGAQTERENLVTDRLKRTGQYPGTAGTGNVRNEMLDARKPLSDILAGRSGGLYRGRTPYTPEEARQLAEAHNTRAAEIERTTGVPQSYINIREPAGPGFSPDTSAVSPEIVTGLGEYQRRQGGVAQPPLGPAAPLPTEAAPTPQEPAATVRQRLMSAHELMAQDTQRMSDDQIGMLNLDEATLSVEQRKIFDRLRAEAQRELQGKSPARRKAIAEAYSRRFLEALNATPQ